jgi:hypothetical protein
MAIVYFLVVAMPSIAFPTLAALALVFSLPISPTYYLTNPP